MVKDQGTRILFIAPQPFYEDRGTPIAIYYTLVALSELDFQVDLATFPLGSKVDLPGLRVFRTLNLLRVKSVPIGLSFRKIFLDICLLLTVFRLVIRNRYYCIHGVEDGAILALFYKAIFGLPVVYDMHSCLPEKLSEFPFLRTGPGRWLSIKVERWLVRNTDCIIISRGLAQRVLSIEPGKKVFECYFSGMQVVSRNDDLARTLGVFGRPAVVYTGTFAYYQGLDLLFKAAVLVKKEIPEIVFLLIGGTEKEIARFSKLIQRLGLEDNVKVLQRRPRQEIPSFLAISDVLVLPRISGENAPLKLFEYMKSGKPILATDIAAHRTLLSEDTAILVEPIASDFAAGILNLLRNTELAKKIAEAAVVSAKINETKPLAEVVAKAYSLVIGND